MRLAAYQAPLLPAGSMGAIGLIRDRVAQCETEGATILCCPEAILGGLADYAPDPHAIAIAPGAELNRALAPLASEIVTTIVGFTERGQGGAIYNSAAVFHRGAVTGIYRKMHPAIRRSVYSAGTDTQVFTIERLTFGIVICNDSNFPDLVGAMAAQGATALFVPTNNGLPRDRDAADLAKRAREIDVAHARVHNLWVVRADVAGDNGVLACEGSSGVVDPNSLHSLNARPGPDMLSCVYA